jgi:formate/nitrite transporter FocA (FNT family)
VVAAKPKEKLSQKSYHTILEREITEGLRELDRPLAGLFISGLSAGLDVSFSLFLIAVMMTRVKGQMGRPAQEILGAFGHFLVWTTLGNAAGGVFFVALFKYGHVIRGGAEPEAVELEKESPIIVDGSRG